MGWLRFPEMIRQQSVAAGKSQNRVVMDPPLIRSCPYASSLTTTRLMYATARGFIVESSNYTRELLLRCACPGFACRLSEVP